MGYHTEFSGSFTVTPNLSDNHRKYLQKFSETRRMKRDADIASSITDLVRESVSLPVGKQGEYYVGATGFCGQDTDQSVVNYNSPPTTQPSLWCKWIPNDDGNAIEWDGGEKFYHYVEWINYLVKNFLKPWGYTINGEVSFCGEDFSDRGTIVAINNLITVRR